MWDAASVHAYSHIGHWIPGNIYEPWKSGMKLIAPLILQVPECIAAFPWAFQHLHVQSIMIISFWVLLLHGRNKNRWRALFIECLLNVTYEDHFAYCSAKGIGLINQWLAQHTMKQARKKLFENGGADFAQGPPPTSKVAQLRKSWKSWFGGGGGGGGTPTLFFFRLKEFGSIFQTPGRGIFVHHQPL